MSIKDINEQEIIHLSRPWGGDLCCCFCCLQKIEVFAPPGQLLGQVTQKFHICGRLKFAVLDESGTEIYRICGPWFTCCNAAFVIRSPDDGQELGAIRKVWSGFHKECYTDADNFEIDFPANCDVKFKALLNGAVILIDYANYEMSPPDRRRRDRRE